MNYSKDSWGLLNAVRLREIHGKCGMQFPVLGDFQKKTSRTDAEQFCKLFETACKAVLHPGIFIFGNRLK
jgi:hypothetical protein